MSTGVRRLLVLVCAAALAGVMLVRSTSAAPERVVASIEPAAIPQAAKFIGAAGCTAGECHKGPKEWWLTLDGNPRGKRQHNKALSQLEDKNAVKYVKAVSGGSDPYVERSCIECHSTGPAVVEGVSCEKCHGPGSLYKVPHEQEKKPASAYTNLGMKDYGGDPKKWVTLCLNCHVLDLSQQHQNLIKAGHPSGDDFRVVEKYTVVQGPPNSHWVKKRHAAAAVASAAPRPAARPVAPVTPGPTAAPGPTATPTATPVPTPTPRPTVAPTVAPPPNTGGLVPPIAPPARPAVVTPAPVIAPSPRRAEPAPPISRGTSTPTPALTPTPTPAPTPTAVPPQPPPPIPSEQPGVSPAPTEAPPVDVRPRSVSGIVASVQGRLINFLTSLIRQNVVVPQRVVPPTKGLRYSGPDAELLKLQDEVIALALEILGSAPPKGGGTK